MSRLDLVIFLISFECEWENDVAKGKTKTMYYNGDFFEGTLINNLK